MTAHLVLTVNEIQRHLDRRKSLQEMIDYQKKILEDDQIELRGSRVNRFITINKESAHRAAAEAIMKSVIDVNQKQLDELDLKLSAIGSLLK